MTVDVQKLVSKYEQRWQMTCFTMLALFPCSHGVRWRLIMTPCEHCVCLVLGFAGMAHTSITGTTCWTILCQSRTLATSWQRYDRALLVAAYLSGHMLCARRCAHACNHEAFTKVSMRSCCSQLAGRLSAKYMHCVCTVCIAATLCQDKCGTAPR